MVEHMICFKLKPETTHAQAERLVEMLKALKTTVPTVVDLTAGFTFTPERGHGYTIGLVVRFNDKEGLEVYTPHPEHMKVREYVKQICDSTLAIDFEF